MDDCEYANVRDLLGSFIGKRVVEITQHDRSEWEETGQSHIWLHFEDGRSLRFIIGDDGYDIEEPDGEEDDRTDSAGPETDHLP